MIQPRLWPRIEIVSSRGQESCLLSFSNNFSIPWTEKPDRLQPKGSQRVGHDQATEQACINRSILEGIVEILVSLSTDLLILWVVILTDIYFYHKKLNLPYLFTINCNHWKHEILFSNLKTKKGNCAICNNIELRDIMLNEVSHIEGQILYDLTYTWNLNKPDSEAESGLVVSRGGSGRVKRCKLPVRK